MNKRKIIALILLIAVSIGAYAQAIKLSETQKQKIKDALTRIQMADATVENVLYNGMTFSELQSIFPKTKLSIEYNTTYTWGNGPQWTNLCYFGTYIIFFSSTLSFNNPVIIGYTKQGERKIYVKKL